MTTTFGATLGVMLTKYSTSQSALARVAGCYASDISRYISGDRNPKRDSVHRIVKALNLPPVDRDALYTAAGLLPPPGMESTYGLQPDYAGALARFWDGVDADTNPVNVDPTAIRAAAASLRLARTEEAA